MIIDGLTIGFLIFFGFILFFIVIAIIRYICGIIIAITEKKLEEAEEKIENGESILPRIKIRK